MPREWSDHRGVDVESFEVLAKLSDVGMNTSDALLPEQGATKSRPKGTTIGRLD